MLGKYLQPLWPRVLLLAVLVLGSIGLQLTTPQVLRQFIDTLQTGSAQQLFLMAILFVGAAFLIQVLSVAAAYVGEDLGWRATNRLRLDLALHTLHLDLAFHKDRTAGEMIERIDGDVMVLANFFSQFVLQLASNALLVVGILVVVTAEDWRAGLVLAGFSALVGLVLGRMHNLGAPYFKAARQSSADFFGYLGERLAGTEEVRANGAVAHVMGGFYRFLRQRQSSERKARLIGASMWLTTVGLFTVGTAVAFAMGAYLVSLGAITLGAAFMIYQFTESLRRPIEAIVRQMQDFGRATGGIARVRELLQTPSSLADGRGTPIASGPLQVDFEGVSFSYRPELAVLTDVNFQLQPGEVLGILGRSGSGKTTITRLLARLYDPLQGCIRLGGTDIRETRFAELRQRVGLVTQEVQLFHASVRDNLTLFDRTMADQRVAAALEELGLGDWLRSLPQGLDTELAPGGAGLSAGEGQLLAFTRVFLHNPGLMIMDEASSRLDPATEGKIDQAVSKLLQNRTAVIVAHRLATVERADTIMVLEDGAVIEYGPRAELARDSQSHFARLLRNGAQEVLA